MNPHVVAAAAAVVVAFVVAKKKQKLTYRESETVSVAGNFYTGKINFVPTIFV